MKKDRNCNMGPGVPTPYPMPIGQMGYPMPMGQPGMYPMNMGGMPINPGEMVNTNVSTGNSGGINTNQAVAAVEQLQAQINNLDRRVSRIENMMQDTKTNSFTSNKFTDSNYHMM